MGMKLSVGDKVEIVYADEKQKVKITKITKNEEGVWVHYRNFWRGIHDRAYLKLFLDKMDDAREGRYDKSIKSVEIGNK